MFYTFTYIHMMNDRYPTGSPPRERECVVCVIHLHIYILWMIVIQPVARLEIHSKYAVL